jgi:hypothetical protein
LSYNADEGPIDFTQFQGKEVFLGYTQNNGEVYGGAGITDGTASATSFTNFGGPNIWFIPEQVGTGLWRTDGTAYGTHEIYGPSGSDIDLDPTEIAPLANGNVVFIGSFSSRASQLGVTENAQVASRSLQDCEHSGRATKVEQTTAAGGSMLIVTLANTEKGSANTGVLNSASRLLQSDQALSPSWPAIHVECG